MIWALFCMYAEVPLKKKNLWKKPKKVSFEKEISKEIRFLDRRKVANDLIIFKYTCNTPKKLTDPDQHFITSLKKIYLLNSRATRWNMLKLCKSLVGHFLNVFSLYDEGNASSKTKQGVMECPPLTYLKIKRMPVRYWPDNSRDWIS